jgi:alpha-tubulin suppressor-like RCC1 family protein
MRTINRALIIAVFLLASMLVGCGTLKVDVDLGSSSGETVSAPPSATSFLPPAATQTWTAPTPSPTQDSTPTPTTFVTAVPGAVDVAAGKAHTCVVLDDGRVKCWGLNEHGQLGNGGMVNSAFPVEVAGLTDAKALAAGWAHTCALTRAGGVICWGYGMNGELGDGGTSDSAVPVDVIGLSSGVIAIEAGDDHTCAVTAGGAVKCWGFNHYGQLGDGTTTSRSVPVAIQSLAGGVRAVAAGWGHTCILSADKSVQCWGNDEYGQLGYGETEDYRFTPMDVKGLTLSAEQISADGGQTCALTIYGGISCWGNNKYGQLGDGTAENRNAPVTVEGLAQGMRRAEAGWNHACGITDKGEVLCWGWNYYGQLGDGTKASRPRPAAVFGLMEGTAAVGIGWAHTCAVSESGGVKCWGLNDTGQLGDGTTEDSQAPVRVFGMGGRTTPAQSPAETGIPKANPAPNPTDTPTPTLTAFLPTGDVPSPGIIKPTNTHTPKR